MSDLTTGPIGPEGPTGATGETGATGPMGPQGPPGPVPSDDLVNEVVRSRNEVAALVKNVVALTKTISNFAPKVSELEDKAATIVPRAEHRRRRIEALATAILFVVGIAVGLLRAQAVQSNVDRKQHATQHSLCVSANHNATVILAIIDRSYKATAAIAKANTNPALKEAYANALITAQANQKFAHDLLPTLHCD